MSKKNDSLPKLLATNEYRVLSPISKSVQLVLKGKFSLRVASSVAGIDHRKLSRIIEKRAVGDTLGKQGRPKLLTDTERDKLVNDVKQIVDSNGKANYNDIKYMVK